MLYWRRRFGIYRRSDCGNWCRKTDFLCVPCPLRAFAVVFPPTYRGNSSARFFLPFRRLPKHSAVTLAGRSFQTFRIDYVHLTASVVD